MATYDRFGNKWPIWPVMATYDLAPTQKRVLFGFWPVFLRVSFGNSLILPKKTRTRPEEKPNEAPIGYGIALPYFSIKTQKVTNPMDQSAGVATKQGCSLFLRSVFRGSMAGASMTIFYFECVINYFSINRG
ncbi:MAG: hypothetical protein JST39_00615 [Bacteroidetes bacterium]|nr:hypothetical protein [Bacteroidota bacterium]